MVSETIHNIINKKDDNGNFILSPLPYTDDYLEPYIGSRTVRFHYYKHLSTYIDNVNAQKGKYTCDVSIEDILTKEETTRGSLYLNASQVFNHYFYFEQLRYKGCRKLSRAFMNVIEINYGSLDNMLSLIKDAGKNIFGSGWVFLVSDYKRNNLSIIPFNGTGTPITEIMLLAVDVWEHAYYLDYQNDREGYIEQFLTAIDWAVVEERFWDKTNIHIY